MKSSATSSIHILPKKYYLLLNVKLQEWKHEHSLTSWLELGPVAIRASKWSLWMRAHIDTVSEGGEPPPQSGCIKPLNCRATSISVAGLRMILVLRSMETWQRGGQDLRRRRKDTGVGDTQQDTCYSLRVL